MAKQHATDSLALRIEEFAQSSWNSTLLPYTGKQQSSKDTVYGFGDVQVLLKPKGDLWIQSAYYKNFISVKNYKSSKHAVDQVSEHLKYIENHAQRLKDDPEDWTPGLLTRIFKSA